MVEGALEVDDIDSGDDTGTTKDAQGQLAASSKHVGAWGRRHGEASWV